MSHEGHDVAGSRSAELIQTDRLDVRKPQESDRSVFVGLFGDAEFMTFSGGVMAHAAASARFDTMVATAADIPFAKRPLVIRSTGELIGYCGVAWFEFDGRRRLEFGYRLVPSARGKGYATEAGRALLAVADARARPEQDPLLAMIDPRNEASQRVAKKLGFTFWKMETVNGYLDQLYLRESGNR